MLHDPLKAWREHCSLISHNPDSPFYILLFRPLSQTSQVRLPEVDNINVRLVYRLHCTLTRVHTEGCGTIDTSHCYSSGGRDVQSDVCLFMSAGNYLTCLLVGQSPPGHGVHRGGLCVESVLEACRLEGERDGYIRCSLDRLTKINH